MNTTLKKSMILSLLFLGVASISNAQQLLSKTTKTWKMHWGVTAGAGVSNFLNNATPDYLSYSPEGTNAYSILYAPRPEATTGLFTEFEPKGKFSLYTSINYTMRAIPKPVFVNMQSSTVDNAYQSFYLNGMYVDFLVFFKPSNKIKIGLGFDLAQFFLTEQIYNGIYSEFAQNYTSYRGLKTVLAYSVNPRMDVQMYVSAGSSMLDKMQIDNISTGATIAYKLRGKEYKIQKEIYNVDYSK